MFYLDDKSKHLFNNISLIESKVLIKLFMEPLAKVFDILLKSLKLY